MTQCPRCGKQNVDPIYPHTCTPLALLMADALEKDKWHVSAVTLQEAAYELRRLHAALEREKASRQAAQIDNEDLKARVARSGVEQQLAVLAEREACAKVCDPQPGIRYSPNSQSARQQCAAAIRARGAAAQQEGETA